MNDRFRTIGSEPTASTSSDPFSSPVAGANSAMNEPVMARAIVGGAFAHQRYTIRRKVFAFWHGVFHLYDPNGNVALYMQKRAMRLREDLRIYSDESKAKELLRIHARTIIDFGATYDVIDSQTETKLGSFRRKGWKSLLQDTWVILDANEREVGTIEEDSMALALVRRFLMSLIPQSFTGKLGEEEIFRFHQRFNPFVFKIDLDFTPDGAGRFDRRLGLAAALLMAGIESRQE